MLLLVLILLLDLVHVVIVLNTILIRIMIVTITNISITRNSISIIVSNTIIISVSGITGSCCKWRRYFCVSVCSTFRLKLLRFSLASLSRGFRNSSRRHVSCSSSRGSSFHQIFLRKGFLLLSFSDLANEPVDARKLRALCSGTTL